VFAFVEGSVKKVLAFPEEAVKKVVKY